MSAQSSDENARLGEGGGRGYIVSRVTRVVDLSVVYRSVDDKNSAREINVR